MRVLAVTNIYPTPRAPASGTFVEQQIAGLRAAGVDVHVVFLDRRARGMRVYVGTAGQLSREVRSARPDLVHVMYGGVLAEQVTRAISGIPVIVSFCGTDLLGQPVCSPMRKMMSRYGVYASHRAAARAAGIIVKSRNLLAALPPSVDRFRVRIIPNGVDLQRFKPMDRQQCRRELDWSPNRFHVLFPTNSGDPVKRFNLASSAVEKITRDGIASEIHQLQGVPHHLVPAWLNASDVLLLTSAQEGSPNIVKEALACAVPVVAVDVGDVRERLQDVEGCYIAEPETVDLAARLRRVHAGPRRTGGSTGIDDLSVERVSVRLRRFYEEVVSAGNPKDSTSKAGARAPVGTASF